MWDLSVEENIQVDREGQSQFSFLYERKEYHLYFVNVKAYYSNTDITEYSCGDVRTWRKEGGGKAENKSQ